jgi:hypothetical protein
MKKLILLTLAAMFVLPAVARAAGGYPLDLSNPTGGRQFDYVLEKYNVWPQPTDPSQLVVNPTTCFWDINDHSEWSASGDLAAGVSSSKDTCVIEGYDPMYTAKFGNLQWWHGSNAPWFGAAVYSKSPSLTITFSYAPQGRSFILTPIYRPSYRDYRYSLCVKVMYAPGDPALELIPGSTPDPLPWGSAPGEGVPTTITLTVANPTGRSVRDILARFGESSDITFPDGCVGAWDPLPPTMSDYPFTWYAGA